MPSARGSHGTCGGSGSGSSRALLSSHRQYGGGGGGDTRLGRQPQGPERGYSLQCRKRKPPPNQRRGGAGKGGAAQPSEAQAECGHAGRPVSSGSVR
ncbi:hypothetical protein NN561_019349 [Cricetulus griseus]